MLGRLQVTLERAAADLAEHSMVERLLKLGLLATTSLSSAHQNHALGHAWRFFSRRR